MRVNDIYSTWRRGNNVAICIFSSFNKKWLKMNRKYNSWQLMTYITHSHLPFTKGQWWDFLKQPCPANLGYCPFHPVHLISNGNLTHACTYPQPDRKMIVRHFDNFLNFFINFFQVSTGGSDHFSNQWQKLKTFSPFDLHSAR